MFSWYAALNAHQRKTFWGCYGGWALDAMDIQLYTFLIPTLTLAWSMSNADAGVLASSALITSALGGWVTGILADRYGRVRMLQITILCGRGGEKLYQWSGGAVLLRGGVITGHWLG